MEATSAALPSSASQSLCTQTPPTFDCRARALSLVSLLGRVFTMETTRAAHGLTPHAPTLCWPSCTLVLIIHLTSPGSAAAAPSIPPPPGASARLSRLSSFLRSATHLSSHSPAAGRGNQMGDRRRATASRTSQLSRTRRLTSRLAQCRSAHGAWRRARCAWRRLRGSRAVDVLALRRSACADEHALASADWMALSTARGRSRHLRSPACIRRFHAVL